MKNPKILLTTFAFFFLVGIKATVVSVVSSAIGLFLIGAAITILTGKNMFYSGMRQVIFGLTAALITFGIGRLIGISI